MVSPLPNLQASRSDVLIQAHVEQRLGDVVVSHRVKWPQEYVLSGSKKEKIQYDQLSITQWVAGFCRIMKEENHVENKEHMLDYLIQLLEDANDFSSDAAMASHAVLLCRMESGYG